MLLAAALAAVVIDQPYCARLLASAGFIVVEIPERPVADIQRQIRHTRLNARQLGIDPNRIALVGGSAANMVGVADPAGNPKSPDPVERVSAAVQAVVAIAGLSDLRRGDGDAAALAEASPVMHIRLDAPPFLLVHGDRDETVPLVQSTHWQQALQAAGVRCDLIIIEHGSHSVEQWRGIAGVREWEREVVVWLNRALGRMR